MSRDEILSKLYFLSNMFFLFQLNHMDLSPVYAGTLMGITNCLSNIMSFLGPLFVGVIVTDTVCKIQFFSQLDLQNVFHLTPFSPIQRFGEPCSLWPLASTLWATQSLSSWAVERSSHGIMRITRTRRPVKLRTQIEQRRPQKI